ncbi:MAG: group 1 truncated hemoglobin [Alphaproteobacteria bacterium]|nr:group 1 truncated hemoglobin [Alphaproteobacteria bacterium]
MAATVIASAPLALAQATTSAGEAALADGTPIKGDAVYKAFNEKAGIDRLTDDFVHRITTDPRIAARFQGANLTRLTFELKAQFCYLLNGPCTYAGKDMKTAHQGMGLRNRDFNALAEDMQKSMDAEHVPFWAQNQLMAKLAPMQHAVVTK